MFFWETSTGVNEITKFLVRRPSTAILMYFSRQLPQECKIPGVPCLRPAHTPAMWLPPSTAKLPAPRAPELRVNAGHGPADGLAALRGPPGVDYAQQPHRGSDARAGQSGHGRVVRLREVAHRQPARGCGARRRLQHQGRPGVPNGWLGLDEHRRLQPEHCVRVPGHSVLRDFAGRDAGHHGHLLQLQRVPRGPCIRPAPQTALSAPPMATSRTRGTATCAPAFDISPPAPPATAVAHRRAAGS